MDVLMPQLGETVAEGKIAKWFKAAGDAVKPGDNLFEIETDKTSMEVPATSAGTLTEIRFQVGEVAQGRRRGGGDLRARARQAAKRARKRASPPRLRSPRAPRRRVAAPQPCVPAPMHGGRRCRQWIRSAKCARPSAIIGPAKLASGTFVTPLARRLAGERGIDLSRVSGSGPHGRIVAADVERLRRALPRPRMATGASAAQVKALYAGHRLRGSAARRHARTIATRLVEAKQTIPHFYLTADLDVGRLIAMREEANAAAPRARTAARRSSSRSTISSSRPGRRRCSASRPPMRCGPGPHPALHAFRYRHCGRARGRADHAGDPQRRDRNRSPRSRRRCAISPNAPAPRSSSRTNTRAAPARSPISACTACANSPPSSIRRTRPSWRSAQRARAPVEAEDGSVKFISQMTVTLSCDHRVVDGALGAELLAAFKDFIEKPVTALV